MLNLWIIYSKIMTLWQIISPIFFFFFFCKIKAFSHNVFPVKDQIVLSHLCLTDVHHQHRRNVHEFFSPPKDQTAPNFICQLSYQLTGRLDFSNYRTCYSRVLKESKLVKCSQLCKLKAEEWLSFRLLLVYC